MTEKEYIEVCKRYSEYIHLTAGTIGYLNSGKFDMGQYQVTDFCYDWSQNSTEKCMGKVFVSCICTNDDIFTKSNPCYKTHDVNQFESDLLLFIKNYKKAQMELREKKLNKDFTND